MKIISGKLKGRVIDGYQIEGTRPTMDRVRESLFAMIQNKIQNSKVLDLFAGSGVLGLESYSNGASFVLFNDKNPICTKNIEIYCKKFQIESNVVIQTLPYQKCLNELAKQEESFDIIFLDPPYKMECFQEIVEQIEKYKLLKDGGIIVFEYDHVYDWKSPYEMVKKKKYGNKFIEIHQNNTLKKEEDKI